MYKGPPNGNSTPGFYVSLKKCNLTSLVTLSFVSLEKDLLSTTFHSSNDRDAVSRAKELRLNYAILL